MQICVAYKMPITWGKKNSESQPAQKHQENSAKASKVQAKSYKIKACKKVTKD